MVNQLTTGGLVNEIDQVVSQIKQAILAVAEDAHVDDARLAITSVDLTLQVALYRELGGNLKFTLFGQPLGSSGSRTSADTQTIEIRLIPESGDETALLGMQDVAENLVEALRAIRQSVSLAASTPPQFTIDEAAVELNFAIDRAGRIDFFVTGEAEETNVQKLKVGLKRV